MQYLKQLTDVVSGFSCMNINYEEIDNVSRNGDFLDDRKQYEICNIESHSINNNGKISYRVRWSDNSITMEPEYRLNNCFDSILEYWNNNNSNNNINKIFVYCRVSSANQDNIRKGHISIHLQEAKCRVYTVKAGAPVYGVVKETKSARNINHQRKLLNIVNCLTDNDLLLIWNITRFSRDPIGGLEIVKKIQDKGASVYFMEDDILIRPTCLPNTIHKFREMLSQSRLESDVISWRVRGHKKIQSTKGSYMGGVAPFGYKIHITKDRVRKLKCINSEQSIITHIKQTARNSNVKRKYSEIANSLNESNKKYRNKDWKASSVKYIHAKDNSCYTKFLYH